MLAKKQYATEKRHIVFNAIPTVHFGDEIHWASQLLFLRLGRKAPEG